MQSVEIILQVLCFKKLNDNFELFPLVLINCNVIVFYGYVVGPQKQILSVTSLTRCDKNIPPGHIIPNSRHRAVTQNQYKIKNIKKQYVWRKTTDTKLPALEACMLNHDITDTECKMYVYCFHIVSKVAAGVILI